MKIAARILFGLTLTLALPTLAKAADLCAPIENLRTRDVAEAKSLYESCRHNNDLFDRANKELGLRAMFSAKDLEKYLPALNPRARAPLASEREAALRWQSSVGDATRQNAGAVLILHRAEATEQADSTNEKDPELKNDKRLLRIRAAIAAQAKVLGKGENLLRYLMLQTEKIHNSAQLEHAIEKFYELEPPIFRAPASLK